MQKLKSKKGILIAVAIALVIVITLTTVLLVKNANDYKQILRDLEYAVNEGDTELLLSLFAPDCKPASYFSEERFNKFRSYYHIDTGRTIEIYVVSSKKSWRSGCVSEIEKAVDVYCNVWITIGGKRPKSEPKVGSFDVSLIKIDGKWYINDCLTYDSYDIRSSFFDESINDE